jgi:hypothetical protein
MVIVQFCESNDPASASRIEVRHIERHGIESSITKNFSFDFRGAAI